MRFRLSHILLLTIAYMALLLTASCGSDVSDNDPGQDAVTGDVALPDGGDVDGPVVNLTVDTSVAPDTIPVGGEAEVMCSAVDEDGNPVEAEFEVTVAPEDGTLTAGTFTTDVAGDYTFTCALKDGSAADDSPAELTVEAGGPAEILTTLEPSEIAAGEQSTVTCALVDDKGNEIAVSPWVVERPEGVDINGMTLTVTETGEHEIRCTAAAAGEVINEPAILTVVAGVPVGMVLKTTPSREWHNLNGQVTFSYDIVDEYGNAIEDADYGELTVELVPAEGMEETGDLRYRFIETGIYMATGSVPGPPAYQDELELICDPDGPVVTITSPERGLTLDVPAMVTVTGTAVDEVTGVESLSMNGEAVEIQENGSFSVDLPLDVGMTTFHVEAVDGVGHTGERIQSVVYSPMWYDMSPEAPAGAWVDDSALAFIHPEFFYHEEDPDIFTLSSFLGEIIDGLDINTLIPSPVAEESIPGCSADSMVYVSDVRMTVPDQINLGSEASPRLVSNPILNAIDGGFRLTVVVEDFSTYVDVDTPDEGILCISADGRVYADVTVGADIFVSLPASGQPSVDLQHLTVTLSNIRIDGFGIAGGLVNLLSEFLDHILAGLIEDLINEQVGDLLGDLGTLLAIDETIDLDPFIGEGEAVPLRVQVTFDQFEVSGTQPGAGVHINAGLSVTAPHNIEPQILGSMARAHCAMPNPAFFAMPQVDDVEIGAFLDAANEALYALWSGGMLHLTVTEESLGDTSLTQYGIMNLFAETAPLLPPVLVDCGEDGALVAQIGDFWAHISLTLFGTPIDAYLYLFAEVVASPVVLEGENGQEVGIQIDDIRLFQADIVDLNEEGEGSRDMLFSLIEDTVPNLIMNEFAAEPITFEIPVLDISSLDDSGIVPENVLLKIIIDGLNVVNGYITGAAHLEQGIPGVDVP